MNWISRNQKFLEPPWFTIQPKFFQTAACIIENIGVVVTVKPSHDDIKHDPGCVVLKKVRSLKILEKPLSDNLEENFLRKQFFVDYFRSKGILREDGTDIRKDCEEYLPSPIKMRTRSKNVAKPPPNLPKKNYLRSEKKRSVFDCQDCEKSFKSEPPLVKHMEKVHAAGFL